MLLSLLYQQKTIKNYKNLLAKDLKDLYIGMNKKQKVKIKIWQISIDIFLNQTLWGLIDCLFWFIQAKIIVLKDLIPKSIIYQKALSRIIRHCQGKKLLWQTHWFWYKTIWRNKKANNKTRWRLYYRMLIGL